MKIKITTLLLYVILALALVCAGYQVVATEKQNVALRAQVTALKVSLDEQRQLTCKMYKTLTGVDINMDGKWLNGG